MTIKIKRLTINGVLWYQVEGLDVLIDQKLLEYIKAKGAEIIDEDAKRLEMEYQALWN